MCQQIRSKRSAVTLCARAKLLTLLDQKFGAFFSGSNHGSLELNFFDSLPSGNWLQLENTPRVFVDYTTFNKIESESSIDFDFSTQEFVILRKENVIHTVA